MRTLWLLRHAKAGYGGDSLPDEERPLNERGREASLRMGRHLAERGALPDLVLCSTALRTRQTLEGLHQGLGAALEVRLEPDLYLASAGELLSGIQDAPDAARSLMVIGHNPGLAQLAVLLAQRAPDERIAEMRRKFPTCALCELEVDAAHWSDLPEGCTLRDYVVPRSLPGLSSPGWTDPAKSS